MKHYCNPLDPNSTLNMDNGSGNLTNKKNKSGGSFRNKGNNILPPTTKVRLNGAGRQVRSANVAGGSGAYFPYGGADSYQTGGAGGREAKGGAGGDGSIPNAYPKCKHIEGEMEEYDNLGMYHIASGVCKKCGMSMVDWDKNNMDDGGRKHSVKSTPKVRPSKREEFEDFLVSLSYKYNDERTLAMDDIYELHISEMIKLLERVEKEVIGEDKKEYKGTAVFVMRKDLRQKLNNLKEELK